MDQYTFEVNGKSVTVYRSVYAPVRSNMFILFSDYEAMVFDPNENDELLDLFKDKGTKYVHILLTHGHYDHISGIKWLKDKVNADVFCQRKCAERIANNKKPLSRLVAMVLAQEDKVDGGHRYQDFKVSYKPFAVVADKTFDKEDKLKFGSLDIEVFSTPGHSEGSACYKLYEQMVFTGDSLIQDTVAITRFPGGNKFEYDTITLPFLRSLPKDTIILPGHGEPFLLKDTKNI